MHQVQNNLGGAYAKFDQPEAQRYLGFRYVSFLRRYFTSMFTNRFGFRGSIKNPKARLKSWIGWSANGILYTIFKSFKQVNKTSYGLHVYES